MFDTTTADDRTPGTAVQAAVEGYGTALAEIVGGLTPGAIPAHQLPGVWDALDRMERLAAAGKTMLAHRVDLPRPAA